MYRIIITRLSHRLHAATGQSIQPEGEGGGDGGRESSIVTARIQDEQCSRVKYLHCMQNNTNVPSIFSYGERIERRTQAQVVSHTKQAKQSCAIMCKQGTHVRKNVLRVASGHLRTC